MILCTICPNYYVHIIQNIISLCSVQDTQELARGMENYQEYRNQAEFCPFDKVLLSLARLGYCFGICLAYSLTSNFLEVAVNVLISFSNLKYIPVVRVSQSQQNKTKQRAYFIVYLKMLQHLLPWPKSHFLLKELISFRPCLQVLCLQLQSRCRARQLSYKPVLCQLLSHNISNSEKAKIGSLTVSAVPKKVVTLGTKTYG